MPVQTKDAWSLPHSSTAERLFGLDAARAAAIVLVMIAHGVGFWAPLIGNRAISPTGVFWIAGIDGVELFFCLSGFLIGRLLLDIGHRGPSHRAIKLFLIRRTMRTLPLYYLVLVAFVLFPQIEPNAQQKVWAYFLLSQNLITPMPSSNWFGPSWSLTIEEWSYLALPLLAFYVCRSARNPIACAALALITIGFAVRLSIALGQTSSTLLNWDLLIRKLVISRIDAIAYGVLAALLAPQCSLSAKRWALPLAVAILSVNIWLCYDPQRLAGQIGALAFFPLTAIGFSLLLPWLAEMQTPRAFAAPVGFMARIAYALYLVHWAFIYLASSAPQPLQLAIYVGGSLLVATALSYAVEYPIMALRPKQV